MGTGQFAEDILCIWDTRLDWFECDEEYIDLDKNQEIPEW